MYCTVYPTHPPYFRHYGWGTGGTVPRWPEDGYLHPNAGLNIKPKYIVQHTGHLLYCVVDPESGSEGF